MCHVVCSNALYTLGTAVSGNTAAALVGVNAHNDLTHPTAVQLNGLICQISQQLLSKVNDVLDMTNYNAGMYIRICTGSAGTPSFILCC